MATERTEWDSTVTMPWSIQYTWDQSTRETVMAKLSILEQFSATGLKAHFHVSSVVLRDYSLCLGWWLIQLGFNEDSKVKSRLQGVSAHRCQRHSLAASEEKSKLSLLESCRCLLSLWIFRKALRSWNVSTHPYSIFPFFLLNKLLDFLNNKVLYQEGRSVMQFEHCRHLPFKGKEHKLEHHRDIEQVRLPQGQDRHTERTIPAMEGKIHPCKYE